MYGKSFDDRCKEIDSRVIYLFIYILSSQARNKVLITPLLGMIINYYCLDYICMESH